MSTTEIKLLDQAMRALETETGLNMRVMAREFFVNGRQMDALVHIDGPVPVELKAEIKAWAQHVNTGALIEQIRQLGRGGILVTDYVNPNLAEKLRHNEIQFMDACGNAFIRAPQMFIFIKGKKRTETNFPLKDRQTRVFNTTGLKVTYIMLRDPEMVNAPYRDIARQANVALGTVGAVMQDLRRAGFLVKRNKYRHLRNYARLLQRWVETYPEKLRPKLLIGRFLVEDLDWWNNIRITEFDAQWGGEIAAANYTNYLKPEIGTIYAQENFQLAELIRAARLRKLDEWTEAVGMKVYIYTRFWKTLEEELEMVDPVLTYADLIATADPRNREVAREIHGQYLAERIREN